MGRLSSLITGKRDVKFPFEEPKKRDDIQDIFTSISPTGRLSDLLKREEPQPEPIIKVGKRGDDRLTTRQESARESFQTKQLERDETRTKEEQRKSTLESAKERLENLLKESEKIETSAEPDFEKQGRLTEDILRTRNLITASQPGFKTGLRESVGLEPTAKFGAQQATEERATASEQAREKAREQKGFTAGRVVGELGKQAALYSTVGNALKGTDFFRTLGTKLGGGKVATFAADQVADLFVDAVIQTPQEVLRGDTIEKIGMNRLFDIGINLGIGAGGEFLKSIKNADTSAFEQVIKDVSPEQARDLMKFDLQFFSEAERADIIRKAALAKPEVPLSPSLRGVEAPPVQAFKESDVLAKPRIGPVKEVPTRKVVENMTEGQEVSLFHGSDALFEKIRPGKAQAGEGIFLTTDATTSKNYGKNTYEVKIKPEKIANQSDFDNAVGEIVDDLKKQIDVLDDKLDKDLIDGFEHEDLTESLYDRITDIEDGTIAAGNAEVTKKLKDKGYDILVSDMVSGEAGKEVLVLNEAIVKGTKNITDLPTTVSKSVDKPQKLSEVLKSEPKVKSIAEDVVQDDFGTLRVDLEDNKGFQKQIREIIEPDVTLPKTTDGLVKEGLGFEVTEPVKAKSMEEVIVRSPNLKDIGPTERWTTDVFRNFEKVFGDDFGIVKKDILDPFDTAKKARVEDEILLTDNLKKDIVDKLGIKKNSKESALVQQFGEKRISLEELKAKSPDKWKEIVEADKWFRQQYDELIDGINAPRIAQGKEPIGKLDNYYRHFNEMGDTFQGIKNVFESNRQISPKLEGLSEFTKPGEKWASFKQRRTGQGKFKDDAVGGFLEYIKAGTYAKHIDPEIPKFRQLKNQLANSTEGTKNINHFIEFLDEYANGLAGKTGFLDRPFQKLIGRKGTAVLNLLNSRMKSNAVLGNASSALSQIANVPQGLAHVKNPKHIAEGLWGYFGSLGGVGDKALYEQSGFLKERLTDSFSKFDTRIIDQPKKLAQWMLGALDETGTKFIWSMEYRKALADGVQNPIKQADDITRKMVAGRGIGEVPELQRQKLFQLVAPFTLEVGNLWKVQKDFLNKKDFAALGILYGANFLLNNAMEDIRGSRVTFDPIDAIQQGINESEGLGDAIFNVAGRLGGEALGNIPTGQAAAQLFPEFAKKTDIDIPEKLQPLLPRAIKTEEGQLKIPSREDIFGETDPTRFGTQLPLTRALQQPLSSLLLPFGGQQIRKTKEGAEALGLLPKLEEGKFKLPEFPTARTKSGKLISPVNVTLPKAIQGLVFGKSAIPEVKAYYESGKPPFGEKQTSAFDELVATGSYDPNELFSAIKDAKQFTKKEERVRELKKTYKGVKLNNILKIFFNYK